MAKNNHSKKKNNGTESKKRSSGSLARTRQGGSDITRREPQFLGTPFTFVRRFSEEMDRLFGGTLASRATDLVGGRWSPPVEMFERDNNLVVSADLPLGRRVRVTA